MAQDWLSDIALAIADGKPVDWTAVDSTPLTDEDRAIVARLRRVEQIVQGHSLANASTNGSTVPRHALEADDIEAADGAPLEWGPLTILERIGGGGYGDVYRARDRRLDRDVALKLLKRRRVKDESKDDATIHEARLLARVRHPNVVTVYGAESIGGRVGLWMELLDGINLAEEVARGPLSPKSVAEIGIDLCGALDAVHRAGVLHHDVKAQNVIRTKDGRIVLADFGAGRDADAGNGDSRRLAGTPAYLAPEVLRGEPATIQSEIYSLGVLLTHLLTGAWPSDGLPDSPPALISTLRRCLEVAPGKRFQSMHEVETALKVYIATEWPQPSRGDRLAGALGRMLRRCAAFMLLGAGLGFAASYLVEEEFRSVAVLQMRPALMSPAAVGGEELAESPDLNSIREALLTRVRLERIILELNLRLPVLENKLMQDFVEDVRRRVEVIPLETGPSGALKDFSIAFSWNSPTAARRVTDRLAGMLMDDYRRLREMLSESRYQFVRAQADEVDERLESLKAIAQRDLTTRQASELEILTLRQRELTARAERIRLTRALEMRQLGPQLEVIEPPRLPDRPTGPNRLTFASIGAAVGLVATLLTSQLRRRPKKRKTLISVT